MNTPLVDVYVGVGSNIDPAHGLRCGVAALRSEFGELRISPVYRSPALGFDGDDFLNIVVGFRSGLNADRVEECLDAIERSGKFSQSGGRYAPRALDCDLLMYGISVDAPRRLPRDDVLRYPFVLGPLADISPQLRHPLDGRAIIEHWHARRAGAQLQRVCEFTALALPADTAATVDGQDLPGHIGGVSGEI